MDRDQTDGEDGVVETEISPLDRGDWGEWSHDLWGCSGTGVGHTNSPGRPASRHTWSGIATPTRAPEWGQTASVLARSAGLTNHGSLPPKAGTQPVTNQFVEMPSTPTPDLAVHRRRPERSR